MTSGLRGRFARSILSVAVTIPLAASVAGATPVAAAAPAFVPMVVPPVVWALPLMSQQQNFNMGESRAFTVYIQNTTASPIPWSVDSRIVSTRGHVWSAVNPGPLSGTIPASTTITTTYVVTAPNFYGGRAEFYVRVFTGDILVKGFHWTFTGSD